ncbi:MAG: patatin-like phospholipase family protein [Hydrogenophilaceae bacterium]|nr:patatin-like phospholipase family protein [Hydrogenophilaceae bacterium]
MTSPAPDKLGLCLSGGGFRASLFHIGVLASLAEREMLHKVEVLSTVSGGSIIGAYYYLKVKQLLEGRRPGCPKPSVEIYRQIVAEIEQEFLEAVQQNIRLRLFLNPFKNAQMIREDYSRSDRLAELLNEYLYNRVSCTPNIRLQDIHFAPAGERVEAAAFNRTEPFKIPILVINATCLNTGHPWHFTGAYVGEPTPRRGFEAGIDTNYRLPQLRFSGIYHEDRDKPAEQQRKLSDRQLSKLRELTLADAVAASAAVPGIFPPLSIHDLYQTPRGDDIVLELSDGGVFDNQGVDALFLHECSHCIVSDACGQLEDQLTLGTKLVQVVQRSSDVMMHKIRSETLYRLHAGNLVSRALAEAAPEVDEQSIRDPSGRTGILVHVHPGHGKPGEAAEILLKENGLKGFALMHLRQSFANSADYPAFPDPVNRPEGMVYRLSGIRTDLDSFSDAEAYALMYDGYCLTHEHLDQPSFQGLGSEPRRQTSWRFLTVRDLLRDQARRCWLHTRLKVGAKLFFRPFHLTPGAAWLRALPFLAALIAGLGLLLRHYWATRLPEFSILTVGDAALALGAAALALLGNSAWVLDKFKSVPLLSMGKRYGPQQILQIATWVAASFMAAGVWLYLKLYNPLYLRDGRLAHTRPGGTRNNPA